jgi:hypothetical protein
LPGATICSARRRRAVDGDVLLPNATFERLAYRGTLRRDRPWLEDAAHGYKILEERQDDVTKMVLKTGHARY